MQSCDFLEKPNSVSTACDFLVLLKYKLVIINGINYKFI